MRGEMGDDAIRVIYEHLCSFDPKPDQLDLFLHTDGGDFTVPWRLLNLLREFASDIALLVPSRACSAGTLAALGADTVVMHPMGVLGPTETEITGPFNPRDRESNLMPIQVEDVLSYLEWVKNDVGINHEEELVDALGFLTECVNPLALGLIKRSALQSQMMGERLMGIRSEEVHRQDALEIVSTLAQKLFYHGHPINRREARDELGLKWVEDAEPDVEKAMWELYCSYEKDMRLTEPFSLGPEAIAANGGKVPEIPVRTANESEPLAIAEVDLEPGQLVWVESEARADCLEEQMTVTLSRGVEGHLSWRYFLREEEWRQKR